MYKNLLVILAVLLVSPAVSIGAAGDIIIDSQGASREQVGVGAVRFPHARHKKKYKCASCHPKIFKAALGANKITMRLNMNGRFCGSPSCHDGRKAFPLYECDKCHISVKK